MATRSKTYPAPEEANAVEKRRGKEATKDIPARARAELYRQWVEPRNRFEAKLRRSKSAGGTALALDLPANQIGRIVEPPQIKREAVSAAKLQAVLRRKKLRPSSGLRPAHLALKFAPKLVEKAAPRKIRKGRGIPNSVFAPDTRFIFQDTSFPWCTTGRVETAGGTCTGTMIGRRLMVTGSHCMQWTGTGAGWVKFTPSYYNGAAPFGVAWGTRVIYWLRADGSDGLSNTETAFDYVLIVLDRNMGDLTGYVGYRTYSSSWNNGNYWQQIGYPGDLTGAQRPAFFSPGAITSTESRSTSGQTGYVLGNFIDTSGGHSGGPYWGWWGSEPWPRLIGTDSTSPSTPGTGTSGDNEAGGGPALSNLITYARNNYP
jgi:V8-like Glu-specific endopeptidase